MRRNRENAGQTLLHAEAVLHETEQEPTKSEWTSARHRIVVLVFRATAVMIRRDLRKQISVAVSVPRHVSRVVILKLFSTDELQW